MSNKIQFLGHSFFKISIGKTNILIDPFFDNNPKQAKRLIKCPVSISSLKDIDLILVSHEHFDHFEKKSIEEIVRRERSLVFGHRSVLNELDVRDSHKVNVDVAKNFNFEGIEISAFHVHHTNSFYPLGFHIKYKGFSLIHFGDSTLTDSLPKVRADNVIIPIGGHGTFDVTDAVRIIKMIKPKIAIPCHFNTFDVIKVNVKDFHEKLRESKIDVKAVVLKPKQIHVC